MQDVVPAFTEMDAARRLGIAALVGLGVGLEREWSGHTTGPDARFAGIRTFLLLGIIGGVSGLLINANASAAGLVALGSGLAMCIVAYIVAVQRPESDIDGTTETAALVVVLLGAVAGYGWLALAAGTGSIVVLVLLEKSRMHALVKHVALRELQAALQFAVLALVVLPLLPRGPFGGALAIQPRSLWTLVLIFSALNFAGFIARRALGAGAGYAVTGTLGGLISSTAVTLNFSRKSRESGAIGSALAYGVLGACTVVVLRVLVVSSILNPPVGLQLAPLLAAPFVAGAAMLAIARRQFSTDAPASTESVGSPLGLVAALQMAIAFQISMSVLALVNQKWGTGGVYSAATLLGLTDMDALTLTMSRLNRGISASVAALAIAIGLLANTLLKASIAVALGSGAFRAAAAMRLMVQAAASAAAIGVYYYAVLR